MRRSSKFLTVAMGLLISGAASEARADMEEAQLYLLEAAGQGMAAKCECGDDLNSYERCLKKQVKPVIKAFKAGAKFLSLEQAGLRQELNIKVEDLVIDCELGSDEPEEEEDPEDSEEEF